MFPLMMDLFGEANRASREQQEGTKYLWGKEEEVGKEILSGAT